jgi:hypothetical protein
MRTWNMRMTCSYEGDNNKITSLAVEQKDDQGVYKPLTIDINSPGFLVFVYSVFTCQHLYMYVNAAERGLLLASSTGSFELVAGDDWMLSDLRVRFEGKLRAGTPTDEQIADIEGRMNQCPVSRNLHPSGVHESKLVLTR